MSDDRETTVLTREADGKGAPSPSVDRVPDPLRDVMKLRRAVRLGVYTTITVDLPFYYFALGYSLSQTAAVGIIGWIIALVAVETAFRQMIKLRKRSAYPNVLLIELGNVGDAALAAQRGLEVIARLLGARAAVIGLRGGCGRLRLAACLGLSDRQAEEILLRSTETAGTAMSRLLPVSVRLATGEPFHEAFGVVPHGVDRIVVAPVIALQIPIGVIVLAADNRRADVRDNQLMAGIGIALGLSLENLRQRDELREGQERLERVITGAPLVLFALDRDGAYTLVEGRGLETLGVRPDGMLGRSIFDMYPDRPEITDAVKQALAGEEVTVAADFDGSVFEARLTPLRDAAGAIAGVIGVAMDISERRRAEAALEESEARLRTIVTNAPIVLFAVDSDGTFTLSEGKGLADLGLKAGEVVGLNAFEVYRDAPQIRNNVERALKGEIVADTVKVGDLAWESIYSPVRDASGAVTSVIGVAGNVTERLRAQEALRESEERYRELIDNASDIVFARDMDGRFFSVNSAAEMLLGYTQDEMLRLTLADITPPEFLAVVQGMTDLKVDKGGRTTYEIEVLAKDGRRVPLEVSSWLVSDGDKPVAVHGIARDITERHQAEEALRESEERTRLVLENALDAIVAIGADGAVTTWNPQAEAMFGWARDEALGRQLSDLIIPEQHREAHRRGIERYLETGEGALPNKRVEITALRRNGCEFPIELAISPSEGRDGITFSAFIRDITERRQTEEALRGSEERFRELFDNASDIVYTHDLTGRFTSINKAAERVTGYTVEEAIGLNIAKIVAPDHLQHAMDMIRQKVQGTGDQTTYEIDIVTKDSRRITLEVGTRLVYEDGKPAGVQGIARDINERKRAEEALRESEEVYRTLVETSPDAVLLTRADGVIQKANRPAALLLGLRETEELTGRNAVEFVAPDDQQRIMDDIRSGFAAGVKRNMEYILVREDGSPVPVEISLSAITDSGGEAKAFVTVARDVTERRKAQETVRESEEKYRDLVENSNEIIYTLDASGVITYISPAVKQLGGYDPEEIAGKTSLSFVHPDDLPDLAASFARTVSGNPEPSEYRLRTKSGGYVWVQTSSRVIYDGDTIVGLRGLIVDIDERKKAEEALRESEDRYGELFENASDLVYAHDLAGNFTSINSAITRIAGYTVDEALAMNVSEMITLEHHARAGSGVQEAFQTGRPATFEMDIHAKDGRTVTLEVSARVAYEDGAPTGVQGIARDITERRRADALLTGEKQVLEMIAAGGSLTAVLELLARVVEGQSSGMKCSVLLLDHDCAVLRHGAAPSLPGEYNQAVDGIAIGPAAGSCGTAAHRKEMVVVSDIAADPLWVDFRDLARAAGLRACWSLPIFSTRGDVLGTFAMYYGVPRTPEKEDIELIERATHIAGIAIEGKEGEQALQRSEERYRNLVNTAQDVIYTLDTAAVLTSLNPAFETVTGWRREDWLGKPFAPIVHPDDLAPAVDLYKKVLAGEATSYELRIKKASGEYLVGEFTSTPLVAQGEVKGVFGIARDITERKKAEDTIRDLAYHDTLTGLPNRVLFEDRLSVALAQAHRSRQMLAVMFLDLDRFKVVNDTMGHSGGDKLLKGVADDLQAILREGDTVARVGGDEFTLLLPGIAKQDDAIDVAQRILDILRGPRLIDGQEFAVTTSIGITVYPQDGADTDTLLRNADTAMYRAKERGRNNLQLYTPAMNAGVLQRLSLENDLRHALERDELRVFYQPIAETQTGRIVATEALLRWQHPERGIVNPDEFIPFAEETGLIVPIGEWALREAMLQNRAWQDAGHPPMRVTVNLSARQLQQEDMISIVARLLRETGLAPQHLQLEITESAVMKNVEMIISMLHQIRRMGVGVSLDDFGTGYSSLSYLKRFPIDSVKIDRSFVRDIATDPSDAAIVTTVIVMARNLKLKVIAEGVETPEQLEFLQKRGCDEYQGYLISRPVEPAEIAGLLESPRRTRAKITRLKSA